MAERLVTRNFKCRGKTGSEGAAKSAKIYQILNMAASADELEEEEYEALAYQQV